MKLKIAIIGLKGLPAYGGSARAGEHLIAMLKDKYDFTVYNISTHTTRKSGIYEGYEQHVFKKFLIRPLNTLSYYIRATIHCLLIRKYDLIHVYHIDAAFIIPLLKLRYKVIAGHRARPQEFSKWNKVVKLYFNLMEFIFYKMPAHCITSVSKPIVEKYQSWTKRHIYYIPNGINLQFAGKKLIPPEQKDYILFASGRVIETKGCHFMLEALKEMQYPGQILVVGNLDHTPAYKKQILDYKQYLNIHFTGLISDKSQLIAYFNYAKIAVYPSMHEGMSNTLLELVSVKTPVVCSDISENKAIFDDSEVTFFKSADVDDLKKKLAWALKNPEAIKNKSDLVFEKVKLEYNWVNISKRYDELYTKLLQ